jgi:uncharacterized RDD family membrane protein YckC
VEIKYPRLIKRVYALLIDSVFKAALIYLFTCIFSLELFNWNKWSWVKGTVLILIIGVYEPLCMWLGVTLGYYMTGMKVKRFLDPTKRINLFQSICRYIVKILFGWLSCFTIGFNQQRRALHDMIGESIVIEKTK